MTGVYRRPARPAPQRRAALGVTPAPPVSGPGLRRQAAARADLFRPRAQPARRFGVALGGAFAPALPRARPAARRRERAWWSARRIAVFGAAAPAVVGLMLRARRRLTAELFAAPDRRRARSVVPAGAPAPPPAGFVAVRRARQYRAGAWVRRRLGVVFGFAAVAPWRPLAARRRRLTEAFGRREMPRRGAVAALGAALAPALPRWLGRARPRMRAAEAPRRAARRIVFGLVPPPVPTVPVVRRAPRPRAPERRPPSRMGRLVRFVLGLLVRPATITLGESGPTGLQAGESGPTGLATGESGPTTLTTGTEE